MFLKVLNKDLKHHGFQYKEGLNVDTVPFNPSGDCESGGLYYATTEHIFKFLSFGYFIADVTIPQDAKVYETKGKFKADRIILSNIRRVEVYINSLPYESQLNAVKQNGYLLKYVKNQTPELCLDALKQNGYALRYVKEQTPEICLTAVKRYGHALQYVKEQTPEICMDAVKRNGMALECVLNQTPEICLEAVKQDWRALYHVINKTREICAEAIKQIDNLATNRFST